MCPTSASPPPDRRARNAARTREAIQRAALELALEQGYGRTTIDHIAQRADVARRTVFSHFTTKESIVFGVFAAAGRDLHALHAPDVASLVTRLETHLREAGAALHADDPLYTLRMRALSRDPTLRAMLRRGLGEVESELTAKVSQAGNLPPGNVGARIVAAAVVALFLALVDDAVDNDGPGTSPVLHDLDDGVAVVRAEIAALPHPATD